VDSAGAKTVAWLGEKLMTVGRSHRRGAFWHCLAVIVFAGAVCVPWTAVGDDVAGAGPDGPGTAGLDGPAAKKPADDGFDLLRLAELEQGIGNGGAEEAAAEGPEILAGYDKSEGFFLKSSDDLFLLKVSGRLQARYTYKGRDPRGNDADTPEEEGRDSSFFELERARVTFSGNVLHPTLQYNLTLDGDTDGESSVDAIDAYIYFQLARFMESEEDIFSIGIGQWKPHFLRQEATSSGRLQMVDRSLANEFFNIDRNLGIWANGGTGPIWYEVAVTNGFDSVGVEGDDVDQIPAFIAKLDFTLVGENEMGKYQEGNTKCSEDPLFVVGFSGATDYSNGTNISAVAGDAQWTAYQFAIDTLFRWSIFSLQAEYMGRWLRYHNAAALGFASGSQYAHGFYIQGGIFLIPSTLELAARASAIWSDDPVFGGSGVEAGPGFNWYISKSHKIKWQTYVVYFDVSDDLPNASESLNSDSPSFASSAANLQAGEQGIMLETQIQLEF
jgi:hypothetical protein